MPADEDAPLRLLEDPDTGDRFLVYATENGLKLDVRHDGDMLWMTQSQIARLFGVERSVVTKHLGNVYAESELDEAATRAKIAQVRTEGGRQVQRLVDHYNLDAVISVGYRVSSTQATVFRKWATGVLVKFALKAFVVDALRLKQPEAGDRIAELREIVRDIRSDEANVYRELRRICSLCQDYDGHSETARRFYQQTQAKLVYAVTSATPSEIVAERADAAQPNMGLRSWPSDSIRKADVSVSKNYLSETEVRELNRLTTILLDIFEDQLDLGRLVVMQDAERLLDGQLQSLGRAVLRGGGSMGSAAAKAAAEAQYRTFDEVRRLERRQEADDRIAALAREAKGLPSIRRLKSLNPE